MSGPGLVLVPALLAGAVLVAPGRALPRSRLSTLRGSRRSGPAHRPGRLLPVCCAVSLGLLAAVLMPLPLSAVLVPATCAGGYLGAVRVLGVAERPARVSPLDLAATWDLLGACLSAGLPVPAAVRAVTPHLPAPVAGALRHSAELLALGADPVQAWEPALREQHTAPLARAARHSARSGTALAGVATALAADVRADAVDAAEARAQRAAVLVSGPLGLCFLPAFLCLGIAPVVIGLAGRLSTSW